MSDTDYVIPTEYPPGLKFKLPLWSRRPKEWLIEEFHKGEYGFNRGFRQYAPREEDKVFNLNRFFTRGVRVADLVQPNDPRFGGFDPAGQNRSGNALVSAAYSQSGLRVIVECRLWRGSYLETARNIHNAHLQHRYSLFIAENNATQEAIVDLARHDCPDLPAVGFQTGKNKADPELGLPGLAAEISNGLWTICIDDDYGTHAPLRKHTPGCQCAYHTLIMDLMEYPAPTRQYDSLMAFWFCREGLRGAPMAAQAPVTVQDGYLPGDEVGGSFIQGW